MAVNIRDLMAVLRHALLCLLGIAVLGWSPTAFADEKISEPLRLGIELPLAVLADPGGTLSIEEVSALPADRFTPRQGGFAAGFTASAFWLRVTLPPAVRDGEEHWLVLAPPFIDSIRLFEATATGWRQRDTGDLMPLSTRELDYRDFVFRLRPAGDQPIYLRVASTSTLMLFGALWQPAAFARQALPEARNWGLYFGAMAFIGVVLCGLVIAFRRRQFVVLFLACLFNYGMVAGLQGFHIWLLWPEWPQVASMSLGILVCLGSSQAILLLRECVGMAARFPRLDKVYLIAASLLALAALSVPLGVYHWVAGWVTIVTELATLGAIGLAVRLAWQGNRLQWAFALAFTVHFLAVAPVLGINFGLLAPSRFWHTLWQYELIPHMLAIAGIFLIEIRHAHVAWVSSQNHALMATQEAKQLLEQRVEERTKDLAAAQQGLQAALASERRALFEHRQFMAMVSHEFRTPLAVIDAAAHNLVDTPPVDQEELEGRAAQVLRATSRLTKLTDTCLADARLRDDAFALQRQSVDIAVLLREAAEIVSWSPKHRLDLTCPEKSIIWPCDPALIRIAVSNLLDNAVKYGGGGKVGLSAEVSDEQLLIQVSDTGTGIPDDERERIFERYQRGQGAAEGKGGGLGLAVVRMIAEAHGGKISLLPETNHQGCTFALCLPYIEENTIA